MPKFKLDNLDDDEKAEFNEERELLWRESHPDLGPQFFKSNFIIQATKDRIWYRNLDKKKGELDWMTNDHPRLGPLPHPWQLRLCVDRDYDQRIPKYYNAETRRTRRHDPRHDGADMEKENAIGDEARKSELRKLRKSERPSISLDIAGATKKAVQGKELGRDFVHQPIGLVNERHRYELVHTIDDGGGGKGAMNGGVFVVKLEGRRGLKVEKRFKKDKMMHDMAKTEISMLHKLFHSSISMYSDGFWTETDASLYVEFCDRGDLENLIDAYKKRGDKAGAPVYIPEAFIWHAYLSLLDALTYLLLGRGVMDTAERDYTNHEPEPGWIPVLHRDLKPDNILLRSRTRPSRTKYFYCIISDFGLACNDLPADHPDCEGMQRCGSICGTPTYFAPELCYDPVPRRGTSEENYFPKGFKHSAASDLWAIGATMHSLASADGKSHANERPKDIDGPIFWSGLASIKLPIPDIPMVYSEQLNTAIQLATVQDPDERPSAPVMLEEAVRLGLESGFDQPENMEPLPGWCTKIHEYYARTPSKSM